MQNGLTWTMVDGTKQFWARVGKVTFSFVSPETLNRSSRSLPQELPNLTSLNRTFSNTSMSSVTSTQGSSPEVIPPNVQYPAVPTVPAHQQAYSAPAPGLQNL